MRNSVFVHVIKAETGEVTTSVCSNLRVNIGINWQANHMGNDAIADPRIPIHIGVTENTAAPASGDTNLVGEIAADGLSRTTATFSQTANQSLYTLSANWQYTGASTVTIAKACVASTLTDVNTPVSGSLDTHFLITAVSPVAVLDSNDTLAIDWGINI